MAAINDMIAGRGGVLPAARNAGHDQAPERWRCLCPSGPDAILFPSAA
jgi:hypothetical protein